jgi:hypothetical protein
MKTLMAVVLLIGAVFIVMHRQRLFIRDPLGSVLRNGLEEDGAQVYINYSNDVLLENDHPPMYVTLVQHGQKVGTPAKLSCLHWVVCLTDADVAAMSTADGRSQVESMTSQAVLYQSGSGRQTVVMLH